MVRPGTAASLPATLASLAHGQRDIQPGPVQAGTQPANVKLRSGEPPEHAALGAALAVSGVKVA
jgi:hypothetical protein